MESIFYKIGHKVGSSISKARWFYKSAFGSEDEAIKAETVLGKEMAEKAMATGIVQNEALQKILDSIGNRLQSAFVKRNRLYRYHILADEGFNAFALPGGFIFITLPFLEKISPHQDQVAFVLAHEMMHVYLKHPMERILTDYSIQTIFKLLARRGGITGAANQMLSSFLTRQYSQENELKADAKAVTLMKYAKYNPAASIAVLEILKSAGKEQSRLTSYFSTHPPMDERIRHIHDAIST